jgi:hypothetical protein
MQTILSMMIKNLPPDEIGSMMGYMRQVTTLIKYILAIQYSHVHVGVSAVQLSACSPLQQSSSLACMYGLCITSTCVCFMALHQSSSMNHMRYLRARLSGC